MKYTNLPSFKKHLEQNVDKIKNFLVIVQNSYEREKIFKLILKCIDSKKYNLTKFVNSYSASSIVNIFQNPSFFGGEPLVLIENLSDLNKEENTKLINFLKTNNVNIIIGAESKTDAAIYNVIFEKKGVTLDISSEKPWEKEKRLADIIIEKCFSQKKNVTSVVIEALFERAGYDLSLLEMEIDKLITYSYDKLSIDIDDVKKISVSSIQQTIWQLAEDIVFGKINFDNYSIESTFFYSLLSAIRYQLNIGLKIASLIEDNKSHEISKSFPKIYPRSLQKKREIAQFQKTDFFKKSLNSLFEIEMISKNSNLNYTFLLNYLKTKLIYYSTYDASIIV